VDKRDKYNYVKRFANVVVNKCTDEIDDCTVFVSSV